MTARDDVIVALQTAYETLPAGDLNGFRLGRMLDQVPTDKLVRLANERRMTEADKHRPGYGCGSIQCAGCYPHLGQQR